MAVPSCGVLTHIGHLIADLSAKRNLTAVSR
jgi:hypothetical protein